MLLGGQIREFEVGGACSVFWGKEKCILDFWRGNLKEIDVSENLGVDEKIILKWNLKIG
jgi:hypothetical protein